MKKTETATSHRQLRDRSKLKKPQYVFPSNETQVTGQKSDNSDEKKSPFKRLLSMRGSKSKKKEKAESSDPQTNEPASSKPKQPAKKTKGGRKRKLKESESEPVRKGGVQQDKSAKNSKKIKKSTDNKTYKNATRIEPQLDKEEERVTLETKTDDKRQLKDVLPEVEQINNNIRTLTINTEHVKVVDENETPQVVDEYEEKYLKKIAEIFEKSKEFEGKIDTFYDVEGSQAFYYIDESLQRNIEKLDRIDVMDNMMLKEERKNAIKYIYKQIERLEAKAKECEDAQPNEVVVD